MIKKNNLKIYFILKEAKSLKPNNVKNYLTLTVYSKNGSGRFYQKI